MEAAAIALGTTGGLLLRAGERKQELGECFQGGIGPSTPHSQGCSHCGTVLFPSRPHTNMQGVFVGGVLLVSAVQVPAGLKYSYAAFQDYFAHMYPRWVSLLACSALSSSTSITTDCYSCLDDTQDTGPEQEGSLTLLLLLLSSIACSLSCHASFASQGLHPAGLVPGPGHVRDGRHGCQG
jgi:hypothetical protein